jgi:hypothetical protein
VEEILKHDILKLSKIVMDQNYFRFEGRMYLQHRGLTMGAPTSPILSEFYLQFLENSKIYNLLIDYNISGYFRYVDDILIIYKENTTNTEYLLSSFNKLTPNLKFTLEKETEGKINFLDITIHRESSGLSIEIYRKPTYTHYIILKDSCHPREHKQATTWYLYNRMNNYQLPPDKTQKEINLIQHILHNSGDDTPIGKTTSSNQEHKPNTEKRQWSRFTYAGKETRAISKVFKNTMIRVTYSTNNTLKNC